VKLKESVPRYLNCIAKQWKIKQCCRGWYKCKVSKVVVRCKAYQQKCHPFDMLLVLAEKIKIVNTSTHDELEDIIPRTVMKKQLLGLDLR
jgi:hypothetical protein